MAAQTYNYELSEVRKLLEMNRQQGSRLLEGTYRSLFLTHSDDGRWKWMSLFQKQDIHHSQKITSLAEYKLEQKKSTQKGMICLRSGAFIILIFLSWCSLVMFYINTPQIKAVWARAVFAAALTLTVSDRNDEGLTCPALSGDQGDVHQAESTQDDDDDWNKTISSVKSCMNLEAESSKSI